MIRDATKEDFHRILSLCADFWKYTVYDEPFDADHTLVMVELAFEHGLLIVSQGESGVNGFMAAVKAPILASPNAMQAIELAWYVDPSARNGKAGIQLIKVMEEKVKSQGIKYWNMLSMQSSMPDRVNAMYRKLGYNHTETTFTKVFH